MRRPRAGRWRAAGVARVARVAASAVALAVAVAAAWAAVVLVRGRLPTGRERDLVVPAVVAAGLAALAFAPLRARLVDGVTRLMYGDRRPPEEVVRTFVERASRGTDEDELLLQLAESLRRSMRAGSAEVWTVNGGRLEPAVSVPDRRRPGFDVDPAVLAVLVHAGVVGRAWLELWLPDLLAGRIVDDLRVAAAAHSGVLVGLVVVERTAGEAPFDEHDDRALAELGRRLGVVLDNLQLNSALAATLDDLRRTNEELRASRARLVAAADGERRRIERDLHDGAQQHLVALAVNLRLARDVLDEDPAAAGATLDQLGRDVRGTIQELRDLAHGIYPPLLAQAGIGEALRAAAARSPQAVEVSDELARRCPAEVEAAMYFCCLEALQNAGKHAPDARVRVRLWEEADSVRYEVADDGPGFDPAGAGDGQGLQNMRDRLGAIGGTVSWNTAPGRGTRVVGAVPAGSGG